MSKMQTVSVIDANTGMGTGAREGHSVWLLKTQEVICFWKSCVLWPAKPNSVKPHPARAFMGRFPYLCYIG